MTKKTAGTEEFKSVEAKYNKDLRAWALRAIKNRDESHELFIRAFEMLQSDFNLNPLNSLIKAIGGMRHMNTVAALDYVVYCTGGHIGYDEQKKIPMTDPTKSYLNYDVKNQCYSMKKVSLSKAERKGTEEEQAMALEAKKAKRAELISKLVQTAKGLKWWEFASAAPAPSYKISGLYSALKKANENTENLTKEERSLVAALMDTVQIQGFSEQVLG